jgi:hypothetical protein
VKTIKENLSTLLLLAAIAIIGTISVAHLNSMELSGSKQLTMLQSLVTEHFHQMNAKQDRIVSAMVAKEEALRNDQREMMRELICIGKKTAAIEDRLNNGKNK